MSNNDIWHVICLICILTLPLLFGLGLENSDENLSVTYFLKTSFDWLLRGCRKDINFACISCI